MSKNLIILGNGFDLHCNLKTNFSDFFLESFKSNKSYADMKLALNDTVSKSFGMVFNIGRFLNLAPKLDDNFTVIDAMFIMIYFNNLSEPRYWNNVEFDLQNSLVGKSPFNWHHVHLGLSAEKEDDYDSSFLTDLTLERLMVNFLLEKRVCNVFSNLSEYNEDKLSSFLYNQLYLFEQRFLKYVEAQINIDYIAKAQSCIKQLCPQAENFLSTKILSFNYTNFSGEINKYKIFNIHGSINHKDCIIGVNELPNNSPYKAFTKTKRKLLLNKYDDQTMDFDYESVKNVYIYGHSFNEMDFPAFYTIFNRLKLKDRAGDINFCLFYSLVKEENINDKDKERLLREKFLILLERYFAIYNNPLLMDMVASSRIETKKI